MIQIYYKVFFFFSLISTSFGKKLLRKQILKSTVIVDADPRPDAIQPQINNMVWEKEDIVSDNISFEEANRMLQSEMSLSLDEMNGFLGGEMTMSMDNTRPLLVDPVLVDPVDLMSPPGKRTGSDNGSMNFNTSMSFTLFESDLPQAAPNNTSDMPFLQNQLDLFYASMMGTEYPSFVQGSHSIDLDSVEYSMGVLSLNVTQAYSFNAKLGAVPTAQQVMSHNRLIDIIPLIVEYLWTDGADGATWFYWVESVTISWV